MSPAPSGELDVIARYHRSPSSEGDPLFRIARRIPDGSRVLDVGTAAGALATLLVPRRCVVDGVERDLLGAFHARPFYRRLVIGDLDTSLLQELTALGSYDFVVCADVLEHLRDPLRVLRSCREHLSASGRLLLSVPNATFAALVAELLAGRLEYRVSGLLDRTHLRLFTLSSLVSLAAEGGFDVVAVDAIERPIDETEFDRRYLQALPREVADFLARVPGAATYQWLLELAPASSAAAAASPPFPAPAGAAVHVPDPPLSRPGTEGDDSAAARHDDLAADLATCEELLARSRHETVALRSRLGDLEREQTWVTSTLAWRWRQRLVSRPWLAALYRRLKGV